MSLTPILSGLWLSVVFAFSPQGNRDHHKTDETIQNTASKLEESLNDTIRHTFVIDENNTITLLLNQFKTINWWVEKYLQVFDCAWNEYTIYVRDDYYQVSIIDSKYESVVWYNVKISSNNSESNDDDGKDTVPTVPEILKRIQSQWWTPSIIEDEVVYKAECV